MPTVMITGANRGLGLELARQYAYDGWTVVATCREPERATELTALAGEVFIDSLDVTDAESIDALASKIEDSPIDVLVLNAAVHLQKDCTLEELDPQVWLDELRVNLVAPVMVARRFAENVAKSSQKRVVAISSGSGSTARTARGGNYAYRTGKAALNNAMKALALDLGSQRITVVPISPGHTFTDMGGPDARYSAADSIAKVRTTIAGLRFEDSGLFFNRDGTQLPW